MLYFIGLPYHNKKSHCCHLSILGFDDIKFSSYLTPGLTTLRQPMEQLVASRMELMIQLLSQQAAMAFRKRVFVEPVLVIRESCAALS